MKETDGERWTPPAAPLTYRVLWTGDPDAPEILRETDDLLDALRWLQARDRHEFELRDARGVLLATGS